MCANFRRPAPPEARYRPTGRLAQGRFVRVLKADEACSADAPDDAAAAAAVRLLLHLTYSSLIGHRRYRQVCVPCLC